MSSIRSIAILGAGKLGTVLSQLALRAGYEVYVAGSGDPDKITLSVNILSPGAHAVTTEQAIAKSDVVILALPLGKYQSLPAQMFNGKLTIDAMNYWWEVDGDLDDLIDGHNSSSEMIQDFLPQARVVKALSHMGYHHLLDEARDESTKGRKAIAIAADNTNDSKLVSELVDRLGFDPVFIGPLSSGKSLEPGGPAFGANLTADKLRAVIKNS